MLSTARKSCSRANSAMHSAALLPGNGPKAVRVPACRGHGLAASRGAKRIAVGGYGERGAYCRRANPWPSPSGGYTSGGCTSGGCTSGGCTSGGYTSRGFTALVATRPPPCPLPPAPRPAAVDWRKGIAVSRVCRDLWLTPIEGKIYNWRFHFTGSRSRPVLCTGRILTPLVVAHPGRPREIILCCELNRKP